MLNFCEAKLSSGFFTLSAEPFSVSAERCAEFQQFSSFLQRTPLQKTQCFATQVTFTKELRALVFISKSIKTFSAYCKLQHLLSFFVGFVEGKCWAAELQLSSWFKKKISAEIFDADAELLLSWSSANHSAGSAYKLSNSAIAAELSFLAELTQLRSTFQTDCIRLKPTINTKRLEPAVLFTLISHQL